MADRATLLALAERVEAATGPDRELDIRIGWEMDGEGYSEADLQYATANLHAAHVTPFTSSLDAALTLVPEDRLWVRMDEWHVDEDFIHPRPSASVYRRATSAAGTRLKGAGKAATLPLALCAAALRARAAAEEARDGG